MIEVTVNGEKKQFDGTVNLREAIDTLQLGSQRFAIAVNAQFVPQSHYASVELAHGDDVELLVPMQGG